MVRPEAVEYWCGGDRIRGSLYLPRAGRVPARAVLLCPGYTGTRSTGPYGRYIDHFVNRGYVVLHSDYRGWGESAGRTHYLHPLWQIEDLQAGLTYLETRSEVNPERIGLFGTSFGGGHATYLAGLDSRIGATVAVSAVADGAQWLRGMRTPQQWQEFQGRLKEERRRAVLGEPPELVDPNEEIQIATLERRRALGRRSGAQPDPVRTPLECAQAIIEYSPRRFAADAHRILFMSVANDSVVPPEHSSRLFAVAQEPKRWVTLPGRHHYGAYETHFDTIWRETEAWLGAYL